MRTATVTCPLIEQLSTFVDDGVEGASRAEIERHLDECAACRGLTAALVRTRLSDSQAAPADFAQLDAQAPLVRGIRIGRYELGDSVGAGAMSLVFSAYDTELGRKVALKFLRARSGDPGSENERQRRLFREAQAMARLSHPAVLPVYDAGLHDGRVFIAMELVEGQSLSLWLREAPRSVKQVVDAFMQAGRGLAAAHAAGIVHRDFKPDNVLIGREGRIRVADFGLASLRDAIDLFRGDAKQTESAKLTQTGELVGTPMYMAPEQLAGEAPSNASDQFSFCVALWEGLYGVRPFAGERVELLRAAAVAGLVHPARRGRRVPADVRRVLLRGLAPTAKGRFPEMTALLSALERALAAPRRRAITALSFTLLGLVGLAFFANKREPELLCEGAPGEMAAVWNKSTRDELERAFGSSGHPEANLLFGNFVLAINKYSRTWVDAYTDACKATRLKGEQSEALLDERLRCLIQERDDLGLLSNLLLKGTSANVNEAAKAAASLPPPSMCSGAVLLERQVQPPNAAIASKVAELEHQLGEARALFATGQFSDSESSARQIAKDARDLGYLPVQAEARFIVAQSDDVVSKFPEAERAYEEAFHAAAASGENRIAGKALLGWIWMLSIAESRPDRAAPLVELADALIARLRDDVLLAELLFDKGLLAKNRGDLAIARSDLEHALELQERALGKDNAVVSKTLNQLGNVFRAEGRLTESRASYKRALEMAERIFGPNHPDVASILNNLGIAEWQDLGNYSEAARLLERTVTIASRVALGKDSPNVAINIVNLGGVYVSLGDYEKGMGLLRKGVNVEEAAARASNHIGWAHWLLGSALLDLGRYAEAQFQFQRSREVYQEVRGTVSGEVAHSQILEAVALLLGNHRVEAMRAESEALAIGLKALPSGHPELASIYEAACRMDLELGRSADAETRCKTAADWSRAALGPRQPDVASALSGRAEALLAMSDPEDALAPSEEALAIMQARQGDLPLASRVRFTAARVLDKLGQKARARFLASEARAILFQLNPTDRRTLTAIDAWLAGRATMTGQPNEPQRTSNASRGAFYSVIEQTP